MSHLRFGGVEGGVDVPDVLCALENAERQRGQEVTCCQQTSSWSEGETGLPAEIVGYLLQLRDAVRSEDAFLHHLGEGTAIFNAGVFWHQVEHHLEDGLPCLNFCFAILNFWDWVTAINKKKGC